MKYEQAAQAIKNPALTEKENYKYAGKWPSSGAWERSFYHTWNKISISQISTIQNERTVKWINCKIGESTWNIHQRVEGAKVFGWEVFE